MGGAICQVRAGAATAPLAVPFYTAPGYRYLLVPQGTSMTTTNLQNAPDSPDPNGQWSLNTQNRLRWTVEHDMAPSVTEIHQTFWYKDGQQYNAGQWNASGSPQTWINFDDTSSGLPTWTIPPNETELAKLGFRVLNPAGDVVLWWGQVPALPVTSFADDFNRSDRALHGDNGWSADPKLSIVAGRVEIAAPTESFAGYLATRSINVEVGFVEATLSSNDLSYQPCVLRMAFGSGHTVNWGPTTTGINSTISPLGSGENQLLVTRSQTSYTGTLRIEWDATDIRFYENGALAGTRARPTTMTANTVGFQLLYDSRVANGSWADDFSSAL